MRALIVLMIFCFSANASEVTFETCSEQVSSIQLQTELEEFATNCSNIVFPKTSLLQRTQSEDGKVKAFGIDNFLFMQYTSVVNDQEILNEGALIGTQPSIEQVHRLKLDIPNERVIGLFNNNEIKSYRYKKSGNMLPIREFTPGDSHKVSSFSFSEVYMIVFYVDGRVSFYPKAAHTTGKYENTKPEVIKSVEGSSTRLSQLVDGVVVGDDFYVYDKAEHKVFKFPISAQGDVAPTQTLDPGELSSEVIKVDYSSSLAIVLTLSDGTLVPIGLN